MSFFFKPNLAYPRDDVGPYADAEGIVLAVRDTAIDVRIEGYGVLTAYSAYLEGHPERAPLFGYIAQLHVYNAGGGWYPDDRVVGWRKPE